MFCRWIIYFLECGTVLYSRFLFHSPLRTPLESILKCPLLQPLFSDFFFYSNSPFTLMSVDLHPGYAHCASVEERCRLDIHNCQSAVPWKQRAVSRSEGPTLIFIKWVFQLYANTEEVLPLVVYIINAYVTCCTTHTLVFYLDIQRLEVYSFIKENKSTAFIKRDIIFEDIPETELCF